MGTTAQTLASLALLTALASGQIGAPPPELEAVQWFNTPELSFEELRGKVVLLEAFRTWDLNCVASVPGLNARHARGAKKGLLVIGITFEKAERVEDWVQRYEPTYPIVTLRSTELEGFLGVGGYPTQAVIDPKGSLSYVGFSPESALAAALKEADKTPFWPKKLAGVVELIAERDHPRSWAELHRVQRRGRLDERDAAKAERLRKYLEDAAAAALKRGETRLEEGLVYQAAAALTPYAEAKVPFPATQDAAKLLARIRGEPGFKDEIRAGKLFEEARLQELRRELSDAFEGYVTVLEKFADTKLALVARERAEKLIEDGSPGYRLGCEACRKELRAACEKHAEDVELE